MHRPIAVFDAGIGSYAIVAEIRRAMPRQDIVYLADRASFPYGGKSRADLLAVMQKTIQFLAAYNPSAIVVASNAPSIMVLDDLRQNAAVPIYGVLPPLREALALSKNGAVGIMGVRSMVESSMLGAFVAAHAPDPSHVALINASSLVDLVEDGSFLFAPEKTQAAVDGFLGEVFERHPPIDVLTLSSTHLPWLRRFFERARPQCSFLDPARKIVAELGSGTDGDGIVQGLVTEAGTLYLGSLRAMLDRIGVEITLETVVIGKNAL